MTLAHIIALLVTGTGVGFLSGLLGIGGGLILTPVQYMVYTDMGTPADAAIKLAFGTSLLVIFPTAISGIWRHSRKAVVWWKPAIIMGCSSLLSAFGGASLATHLPGTTLKIIFGVIALAAGIRMLTSKPTKIESAPTKNPWLWFIWAIPIGLITGLIGIGGGIVAIPVLVLALKLNMHSAVATSLAIMTLSSLGGVVGYVINGLGVPDLPLYSLGYVNLPTWLLLSVTSASMAQIGAITAHRISAKWLRYIFIALIFYMGLRMIGIFEWLGWLI